MTAQEFANSLTSEQYIRLLDIAYGEVPAEIAEMTDEELIAALEA